jgi:hypothetical protein
MEILSKKYYIHGCQKKVDTTQSSSPDALNGGAVVFFFP